MPRFQFRTLTCFEPGEVCKFCLTDLVNEAHVGPIYKLSNITVHYFCLLMASSIKQVGKDQQGILGFLIKDIKEELVRGSTLVCSYCKKFGATIKCCVRGCGKIFHLPCGQAHGSLHQFYKAFQSFCGEHRLNQIVPNEIKRLSNGSCLACTSRIKFRDLKSFLWVSCCGGPGFFHRECMQIMASSAGYYFKCPLCNCQSKFYEEMWKYGIFIPEREAVWEQEPNAYGDLLERNNTCSAEPCHCLQGIDYSKNKSDWQIILCEACGGSGTHLKCIDTWTPSKGYNISWLCPICGPVITTLDDNKKNSPRKNDTPQPDVAAVPESCDNGPSLSRENREADLRTNADEDDDVCTISSTSDSVVVISDTDSDVVFNEDDNDIPGVPPLGQTRLRSQMKRKIGPEEHTSATKRIRNSSEEPDGNESLITGESPLVDDSHCKEVGMNQLRNILLQGRSINNRSTSRRSFTHGEVPESNEDLVKRIHHTVPAAVAKKTGFSKPTNIHKFKDCRVVLKRLSHSELSRYGIVPPSANSLLNQDYNPRKHSHRTEFDANYLKSSRVHVWMQSFESNKNNSKVKNLYKEINKGFLCSEGGTFSLEPNHILVEGAKEEKSVTKKKNVEKSTLMLTNVKSQNTDESIKMHCKSGGISHVLTSTLSSTNRNNTEIKTKSLNEFNASLSETELGTINENCLNQKYPSEMSLTETLFVSVNDEHSNGVTNKTLSEDYLSFNVSSFDNPGNKIASESECVHEKIPQSDSCSIISKAEKVNLNIVNCDKEEMNCNILLSSLHNAAQSNSSEMNPSETFFVSVNDEHSDEVRNETQNEIYFSFNDVSSIDDPLSVINSSGNVTSESGCVCEKIPENDSCSTGSKEEKLNLINVSLDEAFRILGSVKNQRSEGVSEVLDKDMNCNILDVRLTTGSIAGGEAKEKLNFSVDVDPCVSISEECNILMNEISDHSPLSSDYQNEVVSLPKKGNDLSDNIYCTSKVRKVFDHEAPVEEGMKKKNVDNSKNSDAEKDNCILKNNTASAITKLPKMGSSLSAQPSHKQSISPCKTVTCSPCSSLCSYETPVRIEKNRKPSLKSYSNEYLQNQVRPFSENKSADRRHYSSSGSMPVIKRFVNKKYCPCPNNRGLTPPNSSPFWHCSIDRCLNRTYYSFHKYLSILLGNRKCFISCNRHEDFVKLLLTTFFNKESVEIAPRLGLSIFDHLKTIYKLYLNGRFRSSVVFVITSANNFFTEDSYFHRIAYIVKKMPETKIVLSTSQYRKEPNSAIINSAIRSFNHMIMDMCRTYSMPLLDVNRTLLVLNWPFF